MWMTLQRQSIWLILWVTEESRPMPLLLTHRRKPACAGRTLEPYVETTVRDTVTMARLIRAIYGGNAGNASSIINTGHPRCPWFSKIYIICTLARITIQLQHHGFKCATHYRGTTEALRWSFQRVSAKRTEQPRLFHVASRWSRRPRRINSSAKQSIKINLKRSIIDRKQAPASSRYLRYKNVPRIYANSPKQMS